MNFSFGGGGGGGEGGAFATISSAPSFLAYRAPLKFCFGFVHYTFAYVYKQSGRLSFFASFKDVQLMLESAPFSKSSLNVGHFDCKSFGICKNLL